AVNVAMAWLALSDPPQLEPSYDVEQR
ncbi:MAG: hypothetical protein ACI8PZ_003736, partial [Myxococcota bacterium]